MLIGDDAGFLNNLKQRHAYSDEIGMPPQRLFTTLSKLAPKAVKSLQATDRFKSSWLHDELYEENTTAWPQIGLFVGSAIIWAEQFLAKTLKIRLPFTLSDSEADHAT